MVKGSNIYAVSGGDFYFSTDKGQNWNKPSSLSNINVFASLPSGLLAGTYYSLFRSTDNGSAWSMDTVSFPPYSNVMDILVNGNLIITAGASSGIIFSNDGGKIWTKGSKNLASENPISLGILGNIFFAGTNGHGIYRSADNGNSWDVAGVSLLHSTITSIVSMASTVFAATDAGIQRSNNNGDTWESAGFDGSNVEHLVVDNGFLFASLSKGGLYRSSDNGTTWSSVGLKNSHILSLFNYGNLYAGTLWDGIFQSSDDGISWNQFGTDPVHVTKLAFDETGEKIFAGTTNTGVYLSTNKGITWSHLDNGLITSIDNRPDITDITVYGDTLVAATTQGIFRSLDNGYSWEVLTSYLLNSQVQAFAKGGNNLYASVFNDAIYTSSDKGLTWQSLSKTSDVGYGRLFINGMKMSVLADSNVYLSQDGGKTWNTIFFSRNTDAMAFSQDGNTLFLGSIYVAVGNDMSDLYGGISRSTDEGANWESVKGYWGTTNSVSDFAVIGKTIFAAENYYGFDKGDVNYSVDNGTTWLSAGLKNANVSSLFVNKKELFAVSWDSVFYTDVPDNINSVELQSHSSITIPSIVSKQLPIHYDTHSPSVKITIYDLLGNIVLAARDVSSGLQEVTLNVTDMPSGMYLLKLQSNDEIMMRKILIFH